MRKSHRYWREDLGSKSSRCCHVPQQPGSVAEGSGESGTLLWCDVFYFVGANHSVAPVHFFYRKHSMRPGHFIGRHKHLYERMCCTRSISMWPDCSTTGAILSITSSSAVCKSTLYHPFPLPVHSKVCRDGTTRQAVSRPREHPSLAAMPNAGRGCSLVFLRSEAYTSLDPCVSYQGKYDEADPLFIRAISIGEKTLGPDHRDVAVRLINRAGLLKIQVRVGSCCVEVVRDAQFSNVCSCLV